MKMKLVAAGVMLLTLGALGEVVENFSSCKDSFPKGNPPALDRKRPRDPIDVRYVKICQRYKNKYRYATLYDTENKIPVFSAYKYEKKQDCKGDRTKITWMIEPQIEDNNKGGEMALQNKIPKSGRQAYNSDYAGSGYDKGHLYPFCHAPDDESANSTFTLTNAAPQRNSFNTVWYNKVEAKVTSALSTCLNEKKTLYVVTGVVPSTGPELLIKGTLVNVPSHFWTMHCCCDNNNKCRFGGFIMHREDDDPKEFTKNDEFKSNLKSLYNTEFTVWDSC